MALSHEKLPSGSCVALIAGRGIYPILCAQNIIAASHELAVVAVDDGVDAEWFDSLPKQNAIKISVGQLAKLLRALKRFGAKFAVMAGQVKPKKLFHGMIPDLKAMLLLASLKERNAASIFGGIAEEIENVGVKLLDSRFFMESELATPGPMSCSRITVEEEDLRFGIRTAREIARLDIGQSVVVRKGTVIAVEDFAGTDDLIDRVGKFNLNDAIFVKTSKRDQDFRFDVPIFGMQTLEKLRKVRIKHVALESQKVIILEKERVLGEAKKCGIGIVGF
jgi:DUF1009 family protein